jgi:nicotinate-nucleotide--dimethylbenzimidazole phosphoribosyltransferase
VLDGFIATAAALVAVRLAPATGAYLVASHRSAEPGHTRLLEALGLVPYLELGMRLGEGTGAALGIGLLRAALACYREMATFKEAGVSEDVR